MVDNFDMAESKYGRIYKVAGPRKFPPSLLTIFLCRSGRR